MNEAGNNQTGGPAGEVHLRAIVVGSSTDEFVARATAVLSGRGARCGWCEDVYSAVGRVSDEPTANGVVFGRLDELSQEDGRFFGIAGRNGYACCCLAGKDLAHKRGEVLAAIKAGAIVFTEAAEIEEALAELPPAGEAHAGDEEEPGRPRSLLDKVVGKLLTGGTPKKNRTAYFLKDEFRASEAELDALFGA